MKDPTAGLEVYLVGGAVRDRLLGRVVRDRDWVVVGATVDEMLKRGFKRVGHDFPVFLHPNSGEQYALARQERKSAPGYHGFVTHSAPDVTLEEDLLRRDLTINALAETPDGEVIDPHGGLEDIKRRQLRHVSPAFAEDPLRVLRVARFAAQLQPFGFEVAAPTLELMRGMVVACEVDTLVAERVQQELAGALAGARTTRFIQVLRDCGALSRVLPEVDAMFEDESARDGLCRALDRAFELGAAPEVCFAVLTYDFSRLPDPDAPDGKAVARVEAICEHLRVPKFWRRSALAVARWHADYMALPDLPAGRILELIEHLNGFREPALLEAFCQVCAALSDDGPAATARSARLQTALAAARQVDAGAVAGDIRRGDSADPKRLNQLIQEAVGDARREAIRAAVEKV